MFTETFFRSLIGDTYIGICNITTSAQEVEDWLSDIPSNRSRVRSSELPGVKDANSENSRIGSQIVCFQATATLPCNSNFGVVDVRISSISTVGCNPL